MGKSLKKRGNAFPQVEVGIVAYRVEELPEGVGIVAGHHALAAAQRRDHLAFPPLVDGGVERALRGLGHMVVEGDGGEGSGTYGGDGRVGGIGDAFGEAGREVAALRCR